MRREIMVRKKIIPPPVLLAFLLGLMPIVGFSDSFFSDGFESGDLSHSDNGFRWMSGVRTKVVKDNPRTGKYSLRFIYPGSSADSDSFSEQRFFLGAELTELWIRWHLFVPENYFHRNSNKSLSAAVTNNKFLYLWSKDYSGSSKWGNTLGFQTWADGHTGNSVLTYNPIDLVGDKPKPKDKIAPPTAIDIASDRGKWIEFTVHFKLQSGPNTSDGVLEVWKRTEGRSRVKLFNIHNMNDTWGPNYTDWPQYNFLDKGYLLGWSNAGFDEDTVFYIDDIEFSTSPILEEEQRSSAAPTAPSGLTAKRQR